MSKDAARLEALLLFLGEPTPKKDLVKYLSLTPEALEGAVVELRASLEGHGIMLVDPGEALALMTDPVASDIIESLTKEEGERGIGKAALETISVLAYLGPSTRSEIEYVRGVNIGSTLRTLMVRGLIERIESGGTVRYHVTSECLGYLGVSRREDLPQFSEVRDELHRIKEAYANVE